MLLSCVCEKLQQVQAWLETKKDHEMGLDHTQEPLPKKSEEDPTLVHSLMHFPALTEKVLRMHVDAGKAACITLPVNIALD
ncbi:hypothetical protein AVEN_228625-1 [Araneus ventricosus]|uniref:Uncharacterized protein n=1 Tax=Araneus ventricosus TaxID=182803 RepID=A0A4Y2GWD5_ARAVE|nr:hypothetical protein AVEN_228625-1 [Araneus ventricosus]